MNALNDFQKEILAGIPDELPEVKEYDLNINHAPKRKDILTKAEKKLAIRNALRYFPAKFHATLAPEFAEELEKYGRIDVAFSNAGMIGRTSLLNTTEEDWKHVIDVNLNGTFYVNQAVLRQMVDKGIKGAVVNTSSIAAQIVSANTGAYAASKGGVSQLTKFAAYEMAPYGIRVNAIAPGASVTKITEGTRFDTARNEKFLSNIPMGRYGEPEETAALALYLGSDDAGYITGQTIMEDGGFSLF